MKSISINTPVGDFHMIFDTVSGKDIVRASGFGDLAELKTRLPKNLAKLEISQTKNHVYAKQVNAYFTGNLQALDNIRRQQPGSQFQQKIWHAMSQIKEGKTLSYKDLAAKANSPAAIRAAGTACGQNRLALLIPCHRIVKSDGSTGNYLYGTKIKTWLLRHEAK